MDGQKGVVLQQGSCPNFREMLTGGAGMSVGEEKALVPFRYRAELGRGLPFGSGRKVAPRPFSFFCSFIFFPFLFSISFVTFSKLIQFYSNKSKKNYTNSKQSFKIVTNKFSNQNKILNKTL
jgi:hypothetical protein